MEIIDLLLSRDFYLVGCVLTLGILLWDKNKQYLKGEDILLIDILVVVVVTFLSWFILLILIFEIIKRNLRKIIIKGKK